MPPPNLSLELTRMPRICSSMLPTPVARSTAA